MDRKKIILTGSTGLIGRNVLPSLLNDNYEVFSLGRNKSLEQSQENFVYSDLAKNIQFNHLPNDVDTIIYLAQSDHFRDFPDKSQDIFAVNTSSVLQMLDYARESGVKRFIYASSGGVYGSSQDVLSENTSLSINNKLGFYLSTKICAEALLENYIPYMSIIILRFFFVYGFGQRKDMLIPRLVERVRQGEPIHLQGKEGFKLNPIYVIDAVHSIKKALLLNNSYKINIGGPEVLSLSQIAEIIGEKFNKKPVYVYDEKEPFNLVGDISLMKNILGCPENSFEQGLNLIQWV